MIVLASRISEQIGSRSVRADAMETVVALLIVPLAIAEAGEAISGETYCENLEGKP